MSGNTQEFIILKAVYKSGEIKTVLVNGESFKEDKLPPPAFFPRANEITEAKEVGVVQVLGDTDWLDDIYMSD
jgi:hypothetical protein